MSDFSFAAKKEVESHYLDFSKLSALILDDMSQMRQAISRQLHSIGISSIAMVGDAVTALEKLENQRYDLIICDYNLNKCNTGQHFLEMLRQEKKIGSTTVFVMMTAEAEYDFVANAAEFLPDDYILKPANEKQIRYRLTKLFDRRGFMMPVLKSFDEALWDKVIIGCDKLMEYEVDARWLAEVLRKKAIAQLNVERHEDALDTFLAAEKLRGGSVVPWVVIGKARAMHSLGLATEAAEVAQGLIEKRPTYVAAYDLLSEIRFESGDFEEAYRVIDASAKILPSAKRLRQVSESAYLLGKLDEAKIAMAESMKLSRGSMVEQSDDFLRMAQIHVDMGNPKEAIHVLEKQSGRHAEEGVFGVSKNAILSQAYIDSGDSDKAKKLLLRANNLLGDRADVGAMAAIGKAALKAGDEVAGLKILTQAAQSDGGSKTRLLLQKSMTDTGHDAHIAGVVDGGKGQILALVDDCTRLMRVARFEEANAKIDLALAIHGENIEALFAAAQLHLLWLKRDGTNPGVTARAKVFLSTLNRLLPKNEKVTNFYRFFRDICFESE